MIVREDDGLLFIRQTEHARLCGVMARAWGDGGFEPARPAELVALAAAEHDNGWAEWEDAPRYNPETGLPYTYVDIPIEQHLEIYRRGIERAVRRHAYVGVLVSLHGSLLYSRFRPDQPGTSEFLAEQRELRDRLIDRLRAADPALRDHCSERVLRTNRDLLFGWDALSLFLCHGSAWLDAIEVPADYAGRRTEIRVEDAEAGLQLSPYPFRESPLELSIAARRTEATEFGDERAMQRALAEAEEAQLQVTLAG